MAIDINDVTFIDEDDLAPLTDLEIQIDDLRIQMVQAQADLRRGLVQLRRKMGLKPSDKIDLAQGVAVPLEATLEQTPAPAAPMNGVPAED